MIRIAILAALLATSANAQSSCAPSIESAIATIKETYGETVQVAGVNSRGTAFVVFANTKTGTWTAIVGMADGRVCVIASGAHFAQAPQGDPA